VKWNLERIYMSRDEPTDRSGQQEALSSLMDGEGQEGEQACRAWRDDANARADWHAYHLIGELLRSDQVRVDAGRDAAFLGRLRQRLATEPLLLAPAVQAVAPRAARRQAWVAPMAVAAGFVAVAGVLVLTRVAAPEGAASERSANVSAPAAEQRVPTQQGLVVSNGPAVSQVSGATGQLIRNAELDRYLAAHQQYNATSALAAPGGAVRKAATVAPGR
jgi:sigma-E factor negative regulatory protein RseA